jgi:hypothetical protein
MAYAPHYLLQFGGTIGTTAQEIWSCGIRMWSDNFTGFDEVDYLENVAADALSDWIARPTTRIAEGTKLTFAKFNHVDASGHYDDGETHEHIYAGTGIAGGSSPGLLPFQCSVVVTWRTNDVSRGPGSKGRIYQPTPSGFSVSGNTGLFPVENALEIATSASDLLNTLDVGLIGGTVVRPTIMSTIDAAHHQIDTVTVDNRLDVQRRRANALVGAQALADVDY